MLPGVDGAPLDRLAPSRARILAEMRAQPPAIEDVQAWYAMQAPRMRAAGRRNLWRTAVEWWRRVTPAEIERARRWYMIREYERTHPREPSEEPAPPAPSGPIRSRRL